jgi:Flp pilus assembly protein TadD
MAFAGDEELTMARPTKAQPEPEPTLVAADADGAESANVGDEEMDRLPLAGVAPGLPLTPAHETGKISIEPFATFPAGARKPRNEIDKLNGLAIEKLSAAEYAAAVDALRRVLSLAPDSAAAHGNLAFALWRSRGAPQAEIHCRRAIAINPNYIPAHRILSELLREREAPNALACYRRLLALDPENFTAHNNAGLLLAKLGRRSEADAAFQRALELTPGNPYVRFNQLMVQPDGDLAEAADCCRRALNERPGNPEIMANLAVILQFSGRYENALSAFERAITTEPPGAATPITSTIFAARSVSSGSGRSSTPRGSVGSACKSARAPPISPRCHPARSPTYPPNSPTSPRPRGRSWRSTW